MLIIIFHWQLKNKFWNAGVLLSAFQGVSAVGAFYELLSQSSLNVFHPEEKKPVAPVELCPILKILYKILIKR